MKIDEIITSNSNNVYDYLNDIPHSYDEIMGKRQGIKGGTKIGKLFEFDLYAKEIYDGMAIINIVDPNKEEVAGATSYINRGKSIEIDSVYLKPIYRGSDLIKHVYIFIMNYFKKPLVSGGFQSKGAKYIWEDLAQTPGVYVYLYKSGRFIDVDPENLSLDDEVYNNREKTVLVATTRKINKGK